MAKEFFKDLPDTSTPINSARLNGLLNGDESMGSIVVDNISSKNIFNINSLILTEYAYCTIIGENKFSVTSLGVSWESAYVPIILNVEPNTDYTISGSHTSTIDTAIEIYNSEITEKISHTHDLPFTFNVGNRDKIAVLFRVSNAQVTANFENIQIEKGNVATEYAPYKDFSGKDNYSTSEQVVGTYKGKPLYRKIINKVLDLSTSGIHYVDLDITNIDKIPYISYLIQTGLAELTFNDAISAIGKASSHKLYIYTNVDWDSEISFEFTIEYTKTTD